MAAVAMALLPRLGHPSKSAAVSAVVKDGNFYREYMRRTWRSYQEHGWHARIDRRWWLTQDGLPVMVLP